MEKHPSLLADEEYSDEEEDENGTESERTDEVNSRRHFRLSQEYEKLHGVIGRWSCPSCTFINDLELLKCQVCGCRKGLLREEEEQRPPQERWCDPLLLSRACITF